MRAKTLRQECARRGVRKGNGTGDTLREAVGSSLYRVL